MSAKVVDTGTNLRDSYDECMKLLPGIVRELRRLNTKLVQIDVYIPRSIAEGSWSTESVMAWLPAEGMYFPGYYTGDPSFTPYVYRRFDPRLPVSPTNRAYQIYDVTSVWQQSKIDRMTNDLLAAIA